MYFLEITGITDVLKKNAHDQNEQTIHVMLMFPALYFQNSLSTFSIKRVNVLTDIPKLKK